MSTRSSSVPDRMAAARRLRRPSTEMGSGKRSRRHASPVSSALHWCRCSRNHGGTVSLGPAEFHGQIARDDVAGTLAELLHEPRIGRQILELNTGATPIEEAVPTEVSLQ